MDKVRANLVRMICGALLLAAGAGCPKDNVKKTGAAPDPDTNSGPDAKREGAKVITARRDSYDQYKLVFTDTDSVSWPRLQRTKWKRIDIESQGRYNQIDCELRIDNASADLNIDIFNGLGTQIGFTPGPQPNHLKPMSLKIEDMGPYFVRVRAAQPKDESDFSVFCAWAEQIPGEEPKAPPLRPAPGRKPPKPQPVVEPQDTLEAKIDRGIEGRIIQAYRDAGKMVLNLDKGASIGIKVGTEGYILSGGSGRQPLEGGLFKIRKVLDDNRSIGEADVRSVGRNNRVVFFVR